MPVARQIGIAAFHLRILTEFGGVIGTGAPDRGEYRSQAAGAVT
jgi:hypothetical protein